MRPHEPPILTAELPGSGGAIGKTPEDFVVEEIPLYPASGQGEHTYVLVRKRARSTPEMLREIARAANVPERDIGYAGLKDKFAVTSQWLSLPARTSAPDSWQLPDGIWLEHTTRHDNKLRTGHLLANRFKITLKGCAPQALSHALSIQRRLSEIGLVNYFGAQRFGQRSENLVRALEWLREGAPRRRVGRFLAKLYPSVIQAELFNRYASRRKDIGLDALILGEVVRLEGSGSMFCVESPETERDRLLSGDIHLTGPIVGPRARPVASQALELEQAVSRELGLSEADLHVLGRAAPGSRRDLVIRIPDLEISEVPGDESAAGLLVTFSLPSGSYATQLIREFTRSPYLSGEEAPSATNLDVPEQP